MQTSASDEDGTVGTEAKTSSSYDMRGKRNKGKKERKEVPNIGQTR